MNYFFLLTFLCGVQTALSQLSTSNTTDINPENVTEIIPLNTTEIISINTTEINPVIAREIRSVNTTETRFTRKTRVSTTENIISRLLRRRKRRVPIVLASIRDTNSGLPKCTGVFVSPSSLMTTARCLFCDRDCNLTVFVNDPEKGKVINYKIKSIKLHEEFEMNPHKNDIGIVELDGSVGESAVMKISDGKVNPNKLRAYSFVGRFRNGQYYFVARRVHVISNAKCTYTLHNYVPESRVCAYTSRRYYLKEQDQGSPLVYLSDRQFHVLGTYVTDNFEFEIGAKIAVYQRMTSYRKWVDRVGRNITDDPKCSTPNPTPTAEISVYVDPVENRSTSTNTTLIESRETTTQMGTDSGVITIQPESGTGASTVQSDSESGATTATPVASESEASTVQPVSESGAITTITAEESETTATPVASESEASTVQPVSESGTTTIIMAGESETTATPVASESEASTVQPVSESGTTTTIMAGESETTATPIAGESGATATEESVATTRSPTERIEPL